MGGNVEVGVVVVSPGEILAEMDAVDAGARALDADIAQQPVRPSFTAGWAKFLAEWRKFYDDHKSFSGRIWNEVYQQTIAYRRKLENWYAAFAREGWTARTIAATSATATPIRDGRSADEGDAADDGGGRFTFGDVLWIAAGALVVGGFLVWTGEED